MRKVRPDLFGGVGPSLALHRAQSDGAVRRWRLRGRRHERGAVAVETALVSTMLITILYGVVEVSFLYRDSMIITSASRAGARMASSLPRQDFAAVTATQVQDALNGVPLSGVQQVWVYKAANGTATPTATVPGSCSTNCARFVPSSGNLVRSGGSGWAVSAQNACATKQDYVGVFVQYTYASRVGLFNGKTLSENTVMRLEPFAGATCSG